MDAALQITETQNWKDSSSLLTEYDIDKTDKSPTAEKGKHDHNFGLINEVK